MGLTSSPASPAGERRRPSRTCGGRQSTTSGTASAQIPGRAAQDLRYLVRQDRCAGMSTTSQLRGTEPGDDNTDGYRSGHAYDHPCCEHGGRSAHRTACEPDRERSRRPAASTRREDRALRTPDTDAHHTESRPHDHACGPPQEHSGPMPGQWFLPQHRVHAVIRRRGCQQGQHTGDRPSGAGTGQAPRGPRQPCPGRPGGL